MKQPDFTRDFYCSKYRKIDYRLRYFEEHSGHDLIYLASYLHDARIDLRKIRYARRRLIIPLERDTWELTRNNFDLWGEVSGRLSIFPVASMDSWQVQLSGRRLVAPEFDFCIDIRTILLESGCLKLISDSNNFLTIRFQADSPELLIRYRDTGIFLPHNPAPQPS